MPGSDIQGLGSVLAPVRTDPNPNNSVEFLSCVVFLMVVMLVTLLAGCGGDADRIAELENQISDLQSQLATTPDGERVISGPEDLTSEERFWCDTDFRESDLCRAVEILGVSECPYAPEEMDGSYDFQAQKGVSEWLASLTPSDVAQACALTFAAR